MGLEGEVSGMDDHPTRQQVGESHHAWYLRRNAEIAADNARPGKKIRVATALARAILLRCPQWVDGVYLDAKIKNLGAGVQELEWFNADP